MERVAVAGGLGEYSIFDLGALLSLKCSFPMIEIALENEESLIHSTIWRNVQLLALKVFTITMGEPARGG